jgi:hypothetical protein
MSDDTMIMIAKSAPTSFSKAVWYAEIFKRSEQQRPNGESQYAAFSRFIEKHPDGQDLFKAYQAAPGPDWQPTDRTTKAELPKPTVAMTKLLKLAEEARSEHPQLTKEQAFDYVATKTVEGRELFSEAKREHLRKQAALTA